MCKHLWRNRLARSAVNRKVAGSSPARCERSSFFFPVTELMTCDVHVLFFLAVNWQWCITVLAVRASISNLWAKGLKKESRKYIMYVFSVPR